MRDAGVHPVLIEQHMELLMDAMGVTTTTADNMTNRTNLLAHVKSM